MNGIYSINLRTMNALIHYYLYLFLNYFYCDDSGFGYSLKVLNKINEIYDKYLIYKDNNYNILVGIINGLYQEKTNFLKSEKFFSKSLIFSLLQYGEPRGRNNDGDFSMLFTAWKTGRNSIMLDSNQNNNENFKELYHCLCYLYKIRKRAKLEESDLKDNNK